MSGLPPHDDRRRGGMSTADDRVTELLIGEATVGLTTDEAAELRRLEADLPAAEREAWSRLVAEIALADDEVERGDVPPMPAGLAGRLAEEGRRHVAARATEAAAPPSLRLSGGAARTSAADDAAWWRMPWLAWTAAAACLLLAILLALDPARRPDTGPAGPADARLALASFLERASDVRSVAWSGNGTDIAGEVLWSDRLQTGFMRLRGIDANDPTEFQYQLWIFDGERNEAFNAVDGGVFDVAAASLANGEVVVPIDAKLRVFEPALFAITTEPPGGVVKHVTDEARGYRIVAVAPVEA